MKISGFGSIGSSSGVNKRRGTGSVSGFADILSAAEASDVGHAGSVSDVAATAGINNLLALQEISEEDVHRRKLLQQGNNILDALEKLRRQILIGSVPRHTLIDIGRQLSVQKQAVSDPQLSALIEDIELRAAVELAKLEVAAAREAGPDEQS
jgi:hypothetical protein